MLQALKVPVAYSMAARMMNWKGVVSGTLAVRAFWCSLMLVSSLLRVIEMRKGEGSAIAAAEAASMERVTKCIIRARSENRCRVFLLKKKGVGGRLKAWSMEEVRRGGCRSSFYVEVGRSRHIFTVYNLS